jgi:mono/diheme cytochrome c family protein/plastocyanin
MKAEWAARVFVALLALTATAGIGWVALRPDAGSGPRVIDMHGRMAETGGWTPDQINAQAGETILLRLTSDDVMHGFAIGHQAQPSVDMNPGQPTEVSLTFERPGKYTYYCTRWCGPNHWRMRGTITVDGPATPEPLPDPPLYQRLAIDLDAPHPAAVIPTVRPSAARGQALNILLPTGLTSREFVWSHSPAAEWLHLRGLSVTRGLSDSEVWDLVARVWQVQTSAAQVKEGQNLFAANCAACHGERGRGDGVMSASLDPKQSAGPGAVTKRPANLADGRSLLGASPALLEGKILRGGMGTGMPYWGPIFTSAQIEDLVSYLYSLHFDLEAGTSTTPS